jgi:hypothetical protein
MSLYQLNVDEESESAKVLSTLYSIKIDMKKSSNSIVSFFNDIVVISPDFRSSHPEELSTTVYFIKRQTGEVVKSLDHQNDLVEEMNIDNGDGFDPIPTWDFFGTNIHKDSIFYDQIYDRLFLPDFLSNLDVIDVNNKKLYKSVCLKEGREYEEEKEGRLSNRLSEAIFSITAINGFIYVTTSRYIYILRRNDLSVETSLKINKNPVKIKIYPVRKEETEALRKDKKEIFFTKLICGFSEKSSVSWSAIYHVVREEEQKDAYGNTVKVSKSEFRIVSEGEVIKGAPNRYSFKQSNIDIYTTG